MCTAKIFKTSSPEETVRVGKVLGALLEPGDLLCLSGDLGAGKTTFARGVALGLGIKGRVTSPTFILINEYPGKIPMYHMDVYRLDGPAGMDDLGYEEYFYGNGVTLVEWAEKVEKILPGERMDIYLAPSSEDSDAREITLKPRGGRYCRLVKEMTASVCSGD
ncbi:MAG: tRNA (adenosine(37)-N6)-threonylcarbamoyltransferase complex ATPase subunit type 1 TsaE [Firmicutes bacterium]|nr:tRNA (adenosine(37)-N6)-threonylcarbamoyltransferase complex ATPase subunit type 1 TsaE [Bacillota bacterium]